MTTRTDTRVERGSTLVSVATEHRYDDEEDTWKPADHVQGFGVVPADFPAAVAPSVHSAHSVPDPVIRVLQASPSLKPQENMATVSTELPLASEERRHPRAVVAYDSVGDQGSSASGAQDAKTLDSGTGTEQWVPMVRHHPTHIGPPYHYPALDPPLLVSSGSEREPLAEYKAHEIIQDEREPISPGWFRLEGVLYSAGLMLAVYGVSRLLRYLRK